ncbi:hypothetical protein [Emticicia sp.]|uniref:hypothetical protein n=1 Tax=Emticicia sp. TaxID=1930953 RepID=UPI003750297B
MLVEYYTFYNSGFKIFGFPLIGLVAISLCVFEIKRLKRKDSFDNKNDKNLSGMYLAIVFVVVWTGFVLFITTKEYIECFYIMNNKKYIEIEGLVEDFSTMGERGHKSEKFMVKGIEFEYSDNISSVGFHNQKIHGGPIDSSKYVKIQYCDYNYKNIILRLWIRESYKN